MEDRISNIIIQAKKENWGVEKLSEKIQKENDILINKIKILLNYITNKNNKIKYLINKAYQGNPEKIHKKIHKYKKEYQELQEKLKEGV